MSRAVLNLEPVTDAIGFMAFRQDQHGRGDKPPLTFVSNERGADVLDAIRTAEKDIRDVAPNCEIANHIGAIGDQIEAALTANDAA